MEKANKCAVNKDRRNIAEATKLLGLKMRKAFKKFAKKLRVNSNILAGENE